MKKCPHCKGTNTQPIGQRLLQRKTGFSDHLTYNCLDCGKTYSREFPLSEDYWKSLGSLLKPFVPPKRGPLEDKYEDVKPLYERLVKEVQFILDGAIQDAEIKIHSRKGRVKTFDSFYDKIIRKEINDDPFEAIDDIAAFRIICLYRSDLERIGYLIRKNFDVIQADTARTRKESLFGYMADHNIVRLQEELRGARYDNIKSLKCEIQVRTILMDAWAAVSHHLDYKKNTDVPSQLRKDFVALSGLFYLADTHFGMFKDAAEASSAKLMKRVDMGRFSLNQEINLDTLRAYLKWKFPKRKESSTSAYSSLLTELRVSNYGKIKQLDDALERAKEQFEQYEKKQFAKGHFRRTGVVRASLGIVDSEYKRWLPFFKKIRKKAKSTRTTKK